MSDRDLADLELIREAALEAGRIALAHRTTGLKIERKPDRSPVTDGDLAVDGFLAEALRPVRPEYGWLSEETPDDAVRLATTRQFIVDPIDGTSAYMGGEPWFAVSIAVVDGGRPVAGVIHAPALAETYAAVAGGGATLDGAAIRPSAADALEDCAMVGDPRLFQSLRWLRRWPPMRVQQRNALAYRICLVADGRFDATVSMGWKNDWDIAAGDLIAREAGAACSDQAGRPLIFNTRRARNAGLVCAGAALHRLILARTAPIDLPADT